MNTCRYVVPLTAAQRQLLRQAERRSRLLDERNRIRAVLLSDQGMKVAEIARALGVCYHTVPRAFDRWERGGLTALKDQIRPGRPRKVPP